MLVSPRRAACPRWSEGRRARSIAWRWRAAWASSTIPRWRGSSRSGRASNCGQSREIVDDTHRVHRRRHHGAAHGDQPRQEGLHRHRLRRQHGGLEGGGLRGDGGGGIINAARRGTLCIDMSTVDPAASRRVAAAAAERGVRFVDAPVSGGTPRAIEGTLAIMVGAAAEDFQAAKPVLDAMGANVIHVGPVGSGEVAKLCNNLIAGVAAVAVSEAFRIAEGFGVDPKVVTEVIAKSSGNTWLMENMHPVPGLVPRAASTNGYAPGFMTDLMCKDVGLAVDAARNLRIPLFVAPAAQQVYRLASSHGLARKDFTSVYTFLKPSAGTAPV